MGICELGGNAIYLSAGEIELGKRESIKDASRVLSRYLDAIVVRTFSHDRLLEIAEYSSIPVINGLTDLLHPCQILSDLFTIIEKRGSYEGLKIAYVGDGNNIANSWIEAAARLPFHLALACPEGYGPDADILKRGRGEAEKGITLCRDPLDAVQDADVVYTDVWTSMGQEDEREERAEALKGYQINRELLSLAQRDVIAMHCLPAHRGEEITAEVIDGPHAVVFDQAENRLHVQKAILEILLE